MSTLPVIIFVCTYRGMAAGAGDFVIAGSAKALALYSLVGINHTDQRVHGIVRTSKHPGSR